MTREKRREIVRYLIFGLLTTVVALTSYQLMEWLLMPGLGEKSYLLSNLISWVAAVSFAYVTNKLFVFGHKSWAPRVVAREASSFAAARLATLGLDQGLCFLFFAPLRPLFSAPMARLTEWLATRAGALGLPFPALTPSLPESLYRVLVKYILIQILIIVANYALSRMLVFRENKKPRAASEP